MANAKNLLIEIIESLGWEDVIVEEPYSNKEHAFAHHESNGAIELSVLDGVAVMCRFSDQHFYDHVKMVAVDDNPVESITGYITSFSEKE